MKKENARVAQSPLDNGDFTKKKWNSRFLYKKEIKAKILWEWKCKREAAKAKVKGNLNRR